MKKPSAIRSTRTPAKAKPDSLTTLLTEVRQLIHSARRSISTIVDTFQVMTNFEIGRRIVEHEQKGAKSSFASSLLANWQKRSSALQIRQEDRGRTYSAERHEHPCEGVQPLHALERATETKA